MIQQAIKVVRAMLPFESSVTFAQIEEAVDNVLIISKFSDIDKGTLIKEIESLYNIRVDDFRIIEAEERRMPWLADNKTRITWTFWSRYRDYLESQKNFSNQVVSQLDKLTDRTMDGLFNPSINAIISKYGLVVGQVQSGKTANYTGLICKAADSGFKLIIVLAGIHNNLRSQTQLRLDEGFLGFDTQHQRAFDRNGIKMGVGILNQDGVAHSLTSSLDKGDFSTGAANSLGINFNTNETIIAVVKKNSKVLERLHLWLNAQATENIDGKRTIRNKSLLIIDDEADNASINTNKDGDEPTRINQQIRSIIGLFDKSGYIGYTATPFANIFVPIKEDELFPRDFIINIPAPSNYIGPEKVFGIRMLDDNEISDTVLPIVNKIDDYQNFVPNGHKRDHPLPKQIPASLQTAIKCFILTCAVRRLRGQLNVHNSMLVHVTRFTAWQKQIKELVENAFDFYRRGIEMNIPAVLKELKDTFEIDTANYKSYKTVSEQILETDLKSVDANIQVHQWEDVIPHLIEAVSRIQVREINGGSGDALNYFDHKTGLSVIAIGGDKLSRGLTLEGLSVSYYLRASRMYDTLMQMGRWFGYRPGYVDLCRLFMSRELNEWFCHITLASEELRSEFDYMADVAGSTPEQYALKVRTHPGVLQISASNKIRRAVTIEVSWAGRLVESYQLSKNPQIIQSNLKTTKDLIGSLGNNFNVNRNNFLWLDIPASTVRPFFQKFKVAENLKKVDPNGLLRYIDEQIKCGELTQWRIGVMTTVNKKDNQYSLESGDNIFEIGMISRTNADEREESDTYFIRKNHIIDPKDEFIDLTPDEFHQALERTRQFHKDNNKIYRNDFPKGEIVRNEFRDPRKPLLLLYFLSPRGANLPEDGDPIIGFAVSFPGSRFNNTISYAVHEQLLPLFNTDDDDIDNVNNDDED